MKATFETDCIAKADRFAFWREAVCDSYVQLDCRTETPDAFDGAIHLRRYDQISISTVCGSNQHVIRRRRDIAREKGASFLLSVQSRAHGEVSQAGRVADLRPGDMALYSSVERYQLSIPDGFSQTVLQIPRAALLARVPSADMLTGIALRREQPFTALLSQTLPALARAMEAEGPQARATAQSALIDLVASALAPLTGTRHALSHPQEQTLIRADAIIRARLAEPDLDRLAVAEAVGLSVRRLNELYGATGTSIASRIRALRMERVAVDLRDPRKARLSVTEIALGHGVRNVQAFSRLFKSHHGQSPSGFRAAATPAADARAQPR